MTLLAEAEVARTGRGTIDLVSLWDAEGRSKDRDPISWLERKPHLRDRVVETGGGPDAPILADPSTAFRYAATVLDASRDLAEAYAAGLGGGPGPDVPLVSSHEDAGSVVRIAMSLLVAAGMSEGQAGRRFICQVKEQAADEGLDEFAEETVVARAQRAVAGFGMQSSR